MNEECGPQYAKCSSLEIHVRYCNTGNISVHGTRPTLWKHRRASLREPSIIRIYREITKEITQIIYVKGEISKKKYLTMPMSYPEFKKIGLCSHKVHKNKIRPISDILKLLKQFFMKVILRSYYLSNKLCCYIGWKVLALSIYEEL